jgi:hypothetical protein
MSKERIMGNRFQLPYGRFQSKYSNPTFTNAFSSMEDGRRDLKEKSDTSFFPLFYQKAPEAYCHPLTSGLRQTEIKQLRFSSIVATSGSQKWIRLSPGNTLSHLSARELNPGQNGVNS